MHPARARMHDLTQSTNNTRDVGNKPSQCMLERESKENEADATAEGSAWTLASDEVLDCWLDIPSCEIWIWRAHHRWVTYSVDWV